MKLVCEIVECERVIRIGNIHPLTRYIKWIQHNEAVKESGNGTIACWECWKRIEELDRKAEKYVREDELHWLNCLSPMAIAKKDVEIYKLRQRLMKKSMTVGIILKLTLRMVETLDKKDVHIERLLKSTEDLLRLLSRMVDTMTLDYKSRRRF